jgi:Bacterial SH3 domain
MQPTRSLAAVLVFATATVLSAQSASAGYGCFRANTDLNIRDRPYSSANVIGNVPKGQILEKRKLFCTLRGYWCAVTTKAGLEGYADKSFMDKTPCP